QPEGGAPRKAAAANSTADLHTSSCRQAAWLVSGSRTCSSCRTSPSAMRLVASASSCITSMRSSSTIIWKLREYRKSPTSTLAALPHTALAVLRPRRRSDSSTTSSWSRVEVWMNSITAASWCASAPTPSLPSPRLPRAAAASSSSMGRRRLPPAPMMYSATWLTRTTSEARRRRISASTAVMSAAARAWISGSRGRSTAAGRGSGTVSMQGPVRGNADYKAGMLFSDPGARQFPMAAGAGVILHCPHAHSRAIPEGQSMARGANKVSLVGNLGNDPDMKNTQGGMAICTLSLATPSVRKDRDGNQEEKTEWHRVKLFGKLGEIAGEYLRKGRQVYIEGRIEYGSYEKDGVKHYTTDIVADEMQMLGGGGEGSAGAGGGGRSERPQRSAPQRREVPAAAKAEFSEDFADDDMPF